MLHVTCSSGPELPRREGKWPSAWAMETLGFLLEKFTAFCTCNLRGYFQAWVTIIVKKRNRTSWTLWVNVTLWISIGHLPWVGGRGLSFVGFCFLVLVCLEDTKRVLLSTWYFKWFSKRKSGYCIKQDKHFSGNYHWLLGLGCDWGGYLETWSEVLFINSIKGVSLSSSSSLLQHASFLNVLIHSGS